MQIMIAEATSITIAFPNWFYGFLACGILVFVAWAAFNYCKVREVCGQYPKIRRALDLISQLLLSHKWIDDHVYVSSQKKQKQTARIGN